MSLQVNDEPALEIGLACCDVQLLQTHNYHSTPSTLLKQGSQILVSDSEGVKLYESLLHGLIKGFFSLLSKVRKLLLQPDRIEQIIYFDWIEVSPEQLQSLLNLSRRVWEEHIVLLIY